MAVGAKRSRLRFIVPLRLMSEQLAHRHPPDLLYSFSKRYTRSAQVTTFPSWTCTRGKSGERAGPIPLLRQAFLRYPFHLERKNRDVGGSTPCSSPIRSEHRYLAISGCSHSCGVRYGRSRSDSDIKATRLGRIRRLRPHVPDAVQRLF